MPFKETAMVLSRAAEDADELKKLISCLDNVTLKGSRELISNKNIETIVANGRLTMAQLTHSYRKPAIDIGPENIPAYVGRAADLEKTASGPLSSKACVYGVICDPEQVTVPHKEVKTDFRKIISGMGAFFLNSEQLEKASP